MAKSKDLTFNPIGKKFSRSDMARMREEIMKIKGWDEKEYTKAYDVYKHKVRTYNKLTGSNLSATVEFYYRTKTKEGGRELFSTLATIDKLSSATGKKISQTSKEKVSADIESKFAGLIDKNVNASLYKKAYDNGEITLKEYTEALKQEAEALKKRSFMETALYGSS